jgi:hypothetical protein
MTVLGDLVARDRRSDATALLAPAVEREYDYRRFCTTAWKVSSLFRHFGVRDGSTVEIADDPHPEPILAFLGTALLGGTARFTRDTETEIDARAVVTPVGGAHEYDLSPGSKRIVYGGPSDDPSVAYFERDVWSENPTEPPNLVGSEQAVLQTDESTYSHADLFDVARSVVNTWDLTANAVVAVRASLREMGTIAAGIVAPLLVGGTILLPDSDEKNEIADYAVIENRHESEDNVMSPESIGQ